MNYFTTGSTEAQRTAAYPLDSGNTAYAKAFGFVCPCISVVNENSTTWIEFSQPTF